MANMFDENGNYNKTEWKPGDRITAGKLNKIEESLEAINNNDIERHKEADERLDALEEQKEAVEERFDELEDLVADNKSEVDTAIYEVHSKMDRLEQEMNDGIDEVHNVAETVDDKIDEVHEVAEEMEELLNETKTFTTNAKAEIGTATTNAKAEIGTATENGLTELEDLIKVFDMEEVYKKVDGALEAMEAMAIKKINPTGNADMDTKKLKELSGTYAVLGEGIFLVNDTIEWGTNTNIKGLGIGSTTIKLADNSNKCMIRFLDAAKSSLSDVLLDGNSSGNTLSMVDTEIGLLEIKTTVRTTLYSQHLNIRNLSIINAPNNGISMFGKTSDSGYNWIFNIDSVKIHKAKKYCWYDQTSDNHFSNLSLSGGMYADLYCVSSSNMYSNLKCDGEPGYLSDGIDDELKGACVILRNGSNLRFSNLDIQSGYHAGLKIFNCSYLYIQGDINNCGTAYINKDEKKGYGLYMRNSKGVKGDITMYPVLVYDVQKYSYDIDYTCRNIDITFNLNNIKDYNNGYYITKNTSILSNKIEAELMYEKYKNDSLLYMLSCSNTDGIQKIKEKNIDYRGIKHLFDPCNFNNNNYKWNSLVGNEIASLSDPLKQKIANEYVTFTDINDYITFNHGLSSEYTITFDMLIEETTINGYTELFNTGYGQKGGSKVWIYPNGMYVQVISQDNTYNKLFASNDIILPYIFNERHRYTFSVKILNDYSVCSVYMDDKLIRCGGISLEADCTFGHTVNAKIQFPSITHVYGIYISDKYIGY